MGGWVGKTVITMRADIRRYYRGNLKNLNRRNGHSEYGLKERLMGDIPLHKNNNRHN